MHIFKDKDASGILEAIAPVCEHLTLTTIDNERSADPTLLGETAAHFIPQKKITRMNDFDTAVAACLNTLHANDILIICGSLSHLEKSRRILSHYERIDV